MRAFEPGQVLDGKYVLRARIGQGGMGAVYCADQPSLGRTVAIKVLHHDLATNPSLVSRFRAEALAATSVHHPRSVTVFDCANLPDGTPYIVMEHLRGRSLSSVIAEEEVPLPRAVEIVGQILGALGAAHARGIVHADVKSDNFIVDQIDGADHVTMIDFGLARSEHVPEPRVGDLDQAVSGTPEYMAPEVIRGEAPGRGADLYGVGIVLYELLAGATPFAGGTALEIMSRQLEDVVIAPSLRRPEREIPRALDDVVLRALDKHTEARFASAEAFATALRRALPAGWHGPVSRARLLDRAAPEAPTRVGGASLPATRLARGSNCGTIARNAILELQREIGAALVTGDVARISDGYAALARQLVDEQRLEAARRELDEGIDVLTAGHDARAPQHAAVQRLRALRFALSSPSGARLR